MRNEDRYVFYNKADSIITLLKQLISTILRSFTCSNILGGESEDAIVIGDEADKNETSSTHDDLVAQKIQQFACDITNNDDNNVDLNNNSDMAMINTTNNYLPSLCSRKKIRKKI